MHAVVIGGTRFIGRHTVKALRAADYHVTIVTRGHHPNPFTDDRRVTHVQGDRNDRSVLTRARATGSPDIVLDCIALLPQQVAAAIDVFGDVDAYVYVSSTGAYARWDVPRRETTTPIEPFTADHAVDDLSTVDPLDDPGAYGPRKAEGDRVCFAAAEDGAPAMVVRPTFVFGPHDYTERLAYWIDRIATHDRVLVPGDGDNLVHNVYVDDVANALHTVAENGVAGEAYNVGARQLLTVDQRLDAIADALDTSVELVHANARELAGFDLRPSDFPLVRPDPSVVATAKLAALGWDSTPHDEALAATVTAHRDSDRTGRNHGPDRDTERHAIDALTS